jgi:uncharacterized membrane protein (DUF106 family)
MKKNVLLLAILVLTSVALVCLPISTVLAQTGTQIGPVSPSTGTAGKEFTLTLQGTIDTLNGSYLIFFRDAQSVDVISYNSSQANVTSAGYNVVVDLPVPKLLPGKYSITLQDSLTASINTVSYHVAAEGIAAIPIAAFLIMLVAVAISFANMSLNRIIITRMIGWHEYRSMQKEISEYNSQRMAALRAKDDKVIEKLKKKESQIQSMQTKMFKPQLVLIPITFIYLVIWPALTGVFPFAVAYVPGLGPQPFFVWYLICSFFFGTIASRVIGVTPIQ